MGIPKGHTRMAMTATIAAALTIAIAMGVFTPKDAGADTREHDPTIPPVASEQSIDEAQRRLTDLEDQCRIYKRQLSEQTEATEAANHDKQDMASRLEAAQSENEKLKAQVKDLEAQVSELEETVEAHVAETAASTSDVADLTISQAEVGAWAEKIDRYLDGSVLSGYGTTFAQAAADFGVDPRLSPAIATIESSNGAYLAAPYNAWGWGGPGNWSSWPDWETAIRAHARGLKEGGYMPFDQAAATKYCDAGYWAYIKPLIEAVGQA